MHHFFILTERRYLFMQLPDSPIPNTTFQQPDIITLLNNYTQLIERTLKTSDNVVSTELRTLLNDLKSTQLSTMPSTAFSEIIRKLDALELSNEKIKRKLKNKNAYQNVQYAPPPVQPYTYAPQPPYPVTPPSPVASTSASLPATDIHALADTITRSVVQTLESSFKQSINDTLATTLPNMLQPLSLQLTRIESELTTLKLHLQNQPIQQVYAVPQQQQQQYTQPVPIEEQTPLTEPIVRPKEERKAPSKKVQSKLSRMMDI